jgi:hypothetical protein
MSWNYRVMRRQAGECAVFSIHEVYYDLEDRIEFFSEEPISPQGETKEQLDVDLELMQEALKKPVLEYDEKIISQKL